MTETTLEKRRKAAKRNMAQNLKNLRKGWGWNKGLTKETDERLMKTSIVKRGKPMLEETKKKLSIIMKEKYKNPENHPNWKGGRKKHGDGYIQIRLPNHPRANPSGYVLEHIVVWENHHNRPLSREIVIHHINGIRDDNRPENLLAIPKGRHSNQTQFDPYKKRIRELELENRRLHEQVREWPKGVEG